MAVSSKLDAIIGRNLHVFDKPGVLSIRPGFKVTDDWLTGERAIVVTVRKKLASPSEGEVLPKEVEGVPVDVREASPAKRQEIEDPQGYSSKLRLTPDTGSVPHFPDERTPHGEYPTRVASAHAQVARIAKPQIQYSAPAGVSLQPVETEATIHLSASPDSGWSTLKAFLGATQTSLTVAMYDFTSAHVKTAVSEAMVNKPLKLVLDHPATNPTADQTDPETVAELLAALGVDFEQAWALTRTDPEATEWIYPAAYHIKVAVRDGAVFWLSSGNWNNSNQPEIEPADKPEDAEAARHGDRDWHVVIENQQLASVFERYILNDLAIAAAHNNPPQAPGRPPTPPTGGSSQTPRFDHFFPARSITGKYTITPVLTPDPGVYTQAVKDLIESAEQKLYMQFQYIEMPKETNADSQGFVELIEAVIARQQAGVDVKIIMSEYETAGYLEQLEAAGLNVVTSVKIQQNVHNKGIVVDSQKVLVSSQNWSTDGTLYNRDAGVIIASVEAAQYFEQIFLHDWEHLAHQKAAAD